ncbi:MAG: T9SS type A sorting domain-containing protein [Flavobacterium sp.]|nr:T9SS type A sorting domain-containing protein [Flavobacterium sp.]
MAFSQNSLLWKGYFSYNEIKDLSQSNDKLVVASENAIFSKNVISGEVKTINTIDGLSGQTISSIYYSQNFKKTIVGYESGLMIVINEIDGSMLNVVDIINKSIPTNVKRVNHFMEYSGIVYVSCDFGIVQYNLATLQFGDTYLIGDNGAQIAVSQTTIFDNKIYAATLSNGIRRADINNPNLNDYSQWTTIVGFGWSGIEAFANELIATSGWNVLKFQGDSYINIATLPESVVDFKKNEDYLVLTTSNHVFVYNPSLIQIADITSNQIPNTTAQFTCATIIGDTVLIGTLEDGVFSKKITSSVLENITPQGHLRNNIFALSTLSKGFWAVYGGYNFFYNPYGFYKGSPAKFGISKYSEKGWLNIPYSNLLEAKALSRIVVNPNNENQVYVSSYYSGLLEFESDQLKTLYNASNTGSDGLKSIPNQVPDDIRVNGTVFDKSGNLWLTSSIDSKGLKVLKTNGQWQSYDMSKVYQRLGVLNFGRMVIDRNGTKWLTSQNDGIIGFNENYNNLFKTIKEGSDVGNLPNNYASAVAIDNRNQLWIGTRNGLRVLPSIDSFNSSEQLTTQPIIIIEENLAQELLYQQLITDIVVDGSNNKWIATADSGVFLVSSDGQKTIYHFTIKNSPLPSNSINDIDINGLTGEVFIATSRGMVSFKGIATEANENLNNAYIYPNPVRPDFTGTVKISGLIDRATIKITDVEGNLVYETTSEGGTIEWDTTAFGKYKVASGVYMVFISSEDGLETKVKKVMIIR